MNHSSKGVLVPANGGRAIPLSRDTLILGRNSSSDIYLPFPTVSSRHCQLLFQRGAWYIQDLGSTNGTRVNGSRIHEKRMLHPEDEIIIAKYTFTIQYDLAPGTREELEEIPMEEIFGQSLLEKAGLAGSKYR